MQKGTVESFFSKPKTCAIVLLAWLLLVSGGQGKAQSRGHSGSDPLLVSSDQKTAGTKPSAGGGASIAEKVLADPAFLHRRLKARNPDYNGRAQFARDPALGLIGDFSGAALTDLSPLRGIPFGALDLKGQPLANLDPLRGMPLKLLGLEDTQVADLKPLKGMKLEKLYLSNTVVTDLSPLSGMPAGQFDDGGDPGGRSRSAVQNGRLAAPAYRRDGGERSDPAQRSRAHAAHLYPVKHYDRPGRGAPNEIPDRGRHESRDPDASGAVLVAL